MTTVSETSHREWPRRWLREAAPGAALVLLTLATYANALSNGFVWDDAPIIVENPDTRDLSAMGRVLLSPDEFPPYYRPLNRASYLVDYQLFGMDPRGFHAVNIALHAANALLLLALARRLFGTRAPAMLAAALLAVHPVLAESVNFVSARNNLFALLFALASFVLFIDADRGGSRGRAWLSGGAFFLGLMSKEQAAGALPVLAAWLAVPGLSALRGSRRWTLLVPHLLALAAYLALRAISLGSSMGPGAILAGLPSRVAMNWFMIPRYLGLVFFPRELTTLHEIPAELPSWPWLAVAWAAIVAVVAFLVRRPSAAGTVGLLWLGFNLLPIANIVPIPSSLVAERFFYVPATGAWLLLADLWSRLYRSVPARPLVAGAAALSIVALGARTVVRNRDWRDDLTLARSAVETNPGSLPARFNLGVVLRDQGDLDGARRQWEAALEMAPGDPGTLTQLGTAAAVAGDLARAEGYYRRALHHDPRAPLAHYNLARLCERTGRPGEALEHYEAFLLLPLPDRGDATLAEVARGRVQRLRSAGEGR